MATNASIDAIKTDDAELLCASFVDLPVCFETVWKVQTANNNDQN